MEKPGPNCSWHLTQSQAPRKKTETKQTVQVSQTAILSMCVQEMGWTYRGIEGKTMAK